VLVHYGRGGGGGGGGGLAIVASPIYIKKYILRQKKKNYRNSNISPCKNIILKKKKRGL
jgi:hypothetical protein